MAQSVSRFLPHALFVITVWGSAFVAIRAALPYFSPENLTVFRFLVTSAFFGVIYIFKPFSAPNASDLVRISLTGLFGFTAYNLVLNYGEQTVLAGPASFIVNTVPIFTAILAFLFLKERLSRRSLLGTAVAFSGVGLIGLGSGSGGFEFSAGVFFLIAAALTQAIYFVLQKPLLGHYSALQVTTMVIWAATLFAVPFADDLTGAVTRATPQAIWSIVYLATIPTIAGFVVWAYINSHMPVSRAANFLFLVPISSTLIGWFWLGEWPSNLALVGGLIALSGVAIANTRKKKKSAAATNK